MTGAGEPLGTAQAETETGVLEYHSRIASRVVNAMRKATWSSIAKSDPRVVPSSGSPAALASESRALEVGVGSAPRQALAVAKQGTQWLPVVSKSDEVRVRVATLFFVDNVFFRGKS